MSTSTATCAPSCQGQARKDSTLTGSPCAHCQSLVRRSLTHNNLLDLLEGRVRALHVPAYYPPELAVQMAQRLTQHPRFGYYENAPDIGRTGMAFFETTADADKGLDDRYYREAAPAMQELREIFAPNFSPMDCLRLQVQELWPEGASLMNLDGRPMFAGLARVFGNGAEALPHQDVLHRDAPDCAAARELITQLGANIYLQPSDSGGELELWTMRPDAARYDALRLDGSYGLDRAKLPPSDLLLSPAAGDLILFDATRVHAVRAAQGGPRVAISCFIGFRGRSRPLSYWS